MKPALRHHLTRLDRALLDLFNERARLFAEAGGEEATLVANVDDLLARSRGPFSPKRLREVFDALDRGSKEAGR